MTTQQPGFSMSQYASSKDLFAAMIARITELESQLAQRFDAADMATAAAQGFRDGVASAALASAPAQAAEPSITLDFKMATDLLGMFCGEPGLVTLQRGDEHCHSGPGLYAWYSDMPEEGAGFLGAEPDDEATPSAPSATAQPVAEPAIAESVLDDAEDAARYRLLRRGQHWSVIDGIGNELRAEALDAATDAARAAQKEGEKP